MQSVGQEVGKLWARFPGGDERLVQERQELFPLGGWLGHSIMVSTRSMRSRAVGDCV